MRFSLKLKPNELKEDEISLPLVILLVIATVGFLTVIGATPNILQILRRRKKKKLLYPSHVNICFNQLIRSGLIIKNKEGKLSLSAKGELRLFKYQEEINRPKQKWDGKWRVVIFDIWERSRKKRNFLRNELSDFGFIKLQNSVWITPYDCEKYINLLKTDIGVGHGVVYIVADRIDNELKLKRIFDLD